MSSNNSYDFLFKIVLSGDCGVGKTNLMSRFTRDEFNAGSKPTIGIDFSIRTVGIDGKNIKSQIWESAEREGPRFDWPRYYRGAVGVVIVYDISRRSTFENIERYWLPLVRENTSQAIVVLIGNKTDLRDSRDVSTDEGMAFAEKHRLSFIETAALDSTNVDTAFQRMLHDIYQKRKDILLTNPAHSNLILSPPNKSCCDIS